MTGGRLCLPSMPSVRVVATPGAAVIWGREAQEGPGASESMAALGSGQGSQRGQRGGADAGATAWTHPGGTAMSGTAHVSALGGANISVDFTGTGERDYLVTFDD